MSNVFKLVIAIVVSELAGIIGSVFTTPSIAGWYAGIVKPALNPPAWVFGPVWTTLFALMGIAAFLVWKKGLDRKDVKIALSIFIGQLVLNIFWSIIFFGLHNPGLAFIEIIFLWLAILATIIAFAKISRPAAWLLVPYILWVSFAGYLNYSIWQLNAGVEQAAVRSVVEDFGHSLKSVSLLSSTASQDIETNYKDFLDPALLAQWKVDPSKAVGRLTSSPWPDRIEIAGMVKIDQGVYEIFGKIIDMTSMGMAGSRPIDLNVTKINVGNFDSRWLITKVSVIANQENELWKHYNDNGISFQYPEKLTTQYVFAQEWPPAVKIQSGIYSCTETPQEISSMSDITSERMVDDRTYCVNIKNEGAAGSVYSSYVYTTAKNGKLVNVSFTLQYPNCNNYDEVQRKACASEREAFDIDSAVDRIVQSI